MIINIINITNNDVNNITNNDILQNAVSLGIIDLSYVQEQIIMQNKKNILKQYGKSIWYSEKEQCWYCHIPDNTKQSKRRKVKRKNKEDIENVIFQYYSKMEKLPNKQTLTFNELFLEYVEYKKMHVSSGTIRRIMSDWNRFYVESDFISKQITEISKIDIDIFLNSVVDKFSIKNKAFKNMCGILKQTFDYAVDAEYIEKSPYRVKINSKKIIHTSKNKRSNNTEVFHPEYKIRLINELKKMYTSRPSYLIPLIILLDFEIGTRIGEILAIRESDISDGKIHIQRQKILVEDISDVNNIKSIGWKIVEYTKSESGDRYIPLTTNALSYLKEIKNVLALYYHQVEDYLFVTQEYDISENAVNKQLIRSCARLGIPELSTHKIRKTYASTLYQNGVPISIISKMLGHSDESTTLKHYIFPLQNDDEADFIVLNALNNEIYNNSVEKVTKSDQKIIEFCQKIKKREKPEKSRLLP